MGATEDTPNTRLSQFVDDDKPSFLGDYNSDMLKIDGALEEQRINNVTTNNLATTAMSLVGEAKTTAGEAQAAATAATAAANTATTKSNTAIADSAAATATANTAKSDASSARADATSARSSATTALTVAREALPNPYRSTVAVFVGTSNVAAGNTQWPQQLSDRMGWSCQNFAVSGMGYTFGGANSFEGQVQRASDSGAFNNSDVGFVFICDAANDARSKNEIFASANIVFALARSKFPNARIIALPMLTSTDNIDRAVDIVFWQRRTITELKRSVIQNTKVEWIDGSWSWHQDGTFMAETVHYNTSGYNRIAYMVERYLRGDDTWVHSDWVDPTVSAGFTNVQVGTTQPLKAMRQFDNILLQGTVTPTRNVAVQDVPVIFPRSVWPYADVTIVAYQGTTPLNATFMSIGQIKLWSVGTSALINFSAVVPHL